jgi:hypothetical protein
MEQPQLAPGLERRPSRSAPPAMVPRIVALSDASDTQSRLTSLIQLILQRTDPGSANHAGLMSLVEYLETGERARNQPVPGSYQITATICMAPQGTKPTPCQRGVTQHPQSGSWVGWLPETSNHDHNGLLRCRTFNPPDRAIFFTQLTSTCANILDHDFGVVRGYSFCGNRMTTLARGSFVLPTG